MNSFWTGFFEHFRQCGRSSAWFIVTLAVSFAGLLVLAWAVDNEHGRVVEAGLGVATCFGILVTWTQVRRTPDRRQGCLRFRELSEDELRKARARLAKRGKSSSRLAPATARARVQARGVDG